MCSIKNKSKRVNFVLSSKLRFNTAHANLKDYHYLLTEIISLTLARFFFLACVFKKPCIPKLHTSLFVFFTQRKTNSHLNGDNFTKVINLPSMRYMYSLENKDNKHVYSLKSSAKITSKVQKLYRLSMLGMKIYSR